MRWQPLVLRQNPRRCSAARPPAVTRPAGAGVARSSQAFSDAMQESGKHCQRSPKDKSRCNLESCSGFADLGWLMGLEPEMGGVRGVSGVLFNRQHQERAPWLPPTAPSPPPKMPPGFTLCFLGTPRLKSIAQTRCRWICPIALRRMTSLSCDRNVVLKHLHRTQRSSSCA